MSDNMYPFVTGSRAYGTPRDDSDIDLVVRMDPHVAIELRNICNSWVISGGRINIIACETDANYLAWARALGKCLAERPCSRDRAIEIHNECGATGYEGAVDGEEAA